MRSVLLSLALAALVGCVPQHADSSNDAAVDAGATDASPPNEHDDAGPTGQDAGVLVPGVDGGADPNARSEYTDNDVFSGVQLCTDQLDNDDDGVADCDDASCQTGVPSCCVGRANLRCCGAAVATNLDWSGCVGPIDACLGRPDILPIAGAPAIARMLEGERRLVIEERAGDSGLTLDEALDPRGGVVRLTATLTAPEGDEAPIDAMGLALIDASLEPSELGRVTPIAGFLVSRNRHEVSMTLAGQTIRSWAVDAAAHDYALTLDPEGLVTLTQDGSELERAHTDWLAPVRAVVYGRGGPDTPGVSASQIGVGQSECDMPDALVRAPDVAIPTRPSFAANERLGEPSVAAFGSRVRMALRIGPDIHLAAPEGAAFDVLTTAPVLSETDQAWGSAGVADPALFATATGFDLYFTAVADDGTRSIGRVSELADDDFDIPGAEQVLAPDMVSEAQIAGFSAPAPFLHGGVLHLAVVEHDEDGSHSIVVWRLDATPSRITVVREPHPDDLFAFDRDEVAAPSVATWGSVTRIYFAGRRGARWSVAVAVSDDASSFRTIEGAEVLEATEEGFDALGARDPSPYVDGDLLRLFYTGTDGTTTDIGSASGVI